MNFISSYCVIIPGAKLCAPMYICASRYFEIRCFSFAFLHHGTLFLARYDNLDCVPVLSAKKIRVCYYSSITVSETHMKDVKSSVIEIIEKMRKSLLQKYMKRRVA